MVIQTSLLISPEGLHQYFVNNTKQTWNCTVAISHTTQSIAISEPSLGSIRTIHWSPLVIWILFSGNLLLHYLVKGFLTQKDSSFKVYVLDCKRTDIINWMSKPKKDLGVRTEVAGQHTSYIFCSFTLIIYTFSRICLLFTYMDILQHPFMTDT